MFRSQPGWFCIMEFLQKNNFLQWVLSGLLLGVGFIFPAAWILGVVGIAYCIHLSLSTSSWKKLILGSLTAWTIKYACALVWFWSVYPVEWLAFDLGNVQLVLIFFYWLTASLWLGFGGVLFSVATQALNTHVRFKVLAVCIPFLWVISEILGSLFFSVVTIGHGGVITSAFSFGFVGYLLAQHTLLIYVSGLYGMYSLGLVIVVLALVLVSLKRVSVHQSVVFISLLYVTGFVPFLASLPKTNDSHHVVTINTQFPPNQIRTPEGAQLIRKELDAAMNAALELEPDYILLPEDARYFNQSQNPNQTKALFRFQKGNPDTIIVDTSRAESGGATVLQSYIYNGLENTVNQSHKRYLVPQGEFMPALYVGVLNLFGYDDLTKKIAKDIAFEVGDKTSQVDSSQTSPGVLFCFESVSPKGVKTILDERGEVPFIAHPISHAWFHESHILWQNLDSMLRVQAIWNRQYIVSAGSHVPSQVVSPNGLIKLPDAVAFGDRWSVSQTYIPK